MRVEGVTGLANGRKLFKDLRRASSGWPSSLEHETGMLVVIQELPVNKTLDGPF